MPIVFAFIIDRWLVFVTKKTERTRATYTDWWSSSIWLAMIHLWWATRIHYTINDEARNLYIYTLQPVTEFAEIAQWFCELWRAYDIWVDNVFFRNILWCSIVKVLHFNIAFDNTNFNSNRTSEPLNTFAFVYYIHSAIVALYCITLVIPAI